MRHLLYARVDLRLQEAERDTCPVQCRVRARIGCKRISVRVIVPSVPVTEQNIQDGGRAEAQPQDEVYAYTGAGMDAPMTSPGEDADALGDVPDERDTRLEHGQPVRW